MSENEMIMQLPVTALRSNPKNPRADLGDVAELASSMKQMGVLEPLIVVEDMGELTGDPTGTYTIVAGHRRHAAATLAGLETVPCVIRSMVGIDQLRAMMAENIVRENMTVFDEAQGFQMMIDLGDTPAEISERTGFSTTTVRRRLKMAELDKEKLREVATDEERQLTLADFDRLAQIEDIKERNKVLEKIGTRDFDSAVYRAVSDQNEKRNMPTVKAWLKKVKATVLKGTDQYSGKYESFMGGSISISKLGEKNNVLPDPDSIKEPIFYYIYYGTLYLRKKKAKAPREQKSKEQLEKERSVREAWKRVKDLDEMFYGLRRQFIEKLTATSTNRPLILAGALVAGLLGEICYNSSNREALEKLVCGDGVTWTNRDKKLWDGYRNLDDQKLATVVYELFGDSEKVNFTKNSLLSNYPRWERTVKIDMLYGWLDTLGYEPSTEEQAWLDGSHEAYHCGEESTDGSKM